MSDTPSNRRPRLERFYFGTNFKMHQTPEETRQFVLDLSAALDVGDAAQLFIIPPHTSLYRLPELADPANIWIIGRTRARSRARYRPGCCAQSASS